VLTWLVVSRLEINHMFLSLVIRAGLSLILYFGVLSVLDARTRGLAKLAMRSLTLGLGLRRMNGEGSAI
jgi:GH15 family glucan-1,4-alpha-glucosidase